MSASKNFSFSTSSLVNEVSVTSVTSNSSKVPVPEGCVTTEIFQFIPWDNEDNIVSKEVDNIFNLIFNGILLPLLFITSFCTNIINMIVFYKHGLQERINACLFTLSLVDLLSITVSFAYSSDVVYMYVIGRGGELGIAAQWFIRYYLIALYHFGTSSQVVYCVIAMERCLCITQPLLVKSFLSTKTTVIVLWVMVFVIIGGAIIVTGPFYSVLCLYDLRDGSISYINYPTDFYFQNKQIFDILYASLYALFFPSASLVGVAICTIITTVKLKKLSKWRESVSSASESVTSRDVAITRVIVGTSILFIVSNVPSVMIRITPILIPEFTVGGRYDNLAWVTRRFYQLGLAINNTFNFFIYYIYGSKFRETTRQLCSCYRDKSIPEQSVKSRT